MTINNNNIFGVFTLNEARGSRLTGDWLNKEFVANYGWFGGGLPVSATVERIDFSNDTGTISPRGSLSVARWQTTATGNSNYGWFGGGFNPAVAFSTVDRIDFSNDSPTASVRGPLSSQKGGMGATGNSNYGWFGSGYVSTVYRIDFSNDSATASVKGPLTFSRGRLGGATGNSNYGWFGGGWIPSPSTAYSTVDRIDFSNDVATASVRGPLSLARYGIGATGNSNYGWFGGGQAPSTPTPIYYSTIDRIDFSNDSLTASVRGPLSSTRYLAAATGNSNYGWWGGGGRFPTTPSPALSTVDRIDFANDSVAASPRNLLTSARYGGGAVSGVLNIRRQKAGSYGWFGGGSIPTPAVISTVDRIDFSNDLATASARGSLSQARQNLAAVGNSNYGWFGGGDIPTPARVATVDRIDFSNDSVTASPRGGTLSAARRNSAATGNSNYGWFGGGTTAAGSSGTVATVDRINFSNDSATPLPRSPLSSARYAAAATGNSNYGWWGGGSTGAPQLSTVDRIDFSNDSLTVSIRGPLTPSLLSKQKHAATGNSNYGWFGGGGTPATVSTVYRIDFSNDSIQASPRGPLSSGRQNHAATGNSNYGWFGGGTPGPVSTVDRINFSNDSVAASVRGLLNAPAGRDSLAATSNTNK